MFPTRDIHVVHDCQYTFNRCKCSFMWPFKQLPRAVSRQVSSIHSGRDFTQRLSDTIACTIFSERRGLLMSGRVPGQQRRWTLDRTNAFFPGTQSARTAHSEETLLRARSLHEQPHSPLSVKMSACKALTLDSGNSGVDCKAMLVKH